MCCNHGNPLLHSLVFLKKSSCVSVWLVLSALNCGLPGEECVLAGSLREAPTISIGRWGQCSGFRILRNPQRAAGNKDMPLRHPQLWRLRFWYHTSFHHYCDNVITPPPLSLLYKVPFFFFFEKQSLKISIAVLLWSRFWKETLQQLHTEPEGSQPDISAFEGPRTSIQHTCIEPLLQARQISLALPTMPRRWLLGWA